MKPGSLVEALDEGEDIELSLGAVGVVAMMDSWVFKLGRSSPSRPCRSDLLCDS
jgi:hypothetical protein